MRKLTLALAFLILPTFAAGDAPPPESTIGIWLADHECPEPAHWTVKERHGNGIDAVTLTDSVEMWTVVCAHARDMPAFVTAAYELEHLPDTAFAENVGRRLICASNPRFKPLLDRALRP